MKRLKSLRVELSSKIFLSILKSILVIIPFPIIVLLIVEMLSLYLIEDTVSDFEDIIMNKVVEELSQSYESAYQVMYNVKNDEDINKYLRNGSRDYWQEYQIYKELNEKTEGHHNIEEMYIFFPQYEYVLSTRFGMDSYSYHSKYYSNTYEEWVDDLRQGSQGSSWVGIDKDTDQNNVLICSIGYDTANQAQLVLRLNNEYLLKLLKSMCFHGGDEAFILYDNQVMISTKQIQQEDHIAQQMLLRKKENRNRLEIDGVNFQLKFHTVSKKGFTLVYAVPENLQYTAVYISKIVGFCAIFFCIIILVWSSFMVSKRNYVPIKRLLEIIREDGCDFKEIDYKTAESYIKTSKERNKQIQLKMQKYEEDVKQLYLGKMLLYGMVKVDTIQVENWGFYGTYYVVLMYTFESSEIERKEFYKEDYRKDIVQEYVQKYMENYTSCYITENEKKIYCVLNGDGTSEEEFLEDIKRRNEEIRTALTKKESLYCDSYISSCCHYLDEIHNGYIEVNQMNKEQISSELEDDVQDDICSIEKITEMINENLSDVNLSVASLAELLKISPSYLSRFFKHKMGIGVLEYIHLQRVKLTKKMLMENRDLKVKDVAEIVGFFNISTFIRVFKKIEGVTPGQFRDSLLELEQKECKKK